MHIPCPNPGERGPENNKTTVTRGLELGNRNVSRTALRQEVVERGSANPGPFQAQSSQASPPKQPTAGLLSAPPFVGRKRSIIYIDGFNFYFGMLAGRPDLKWINYQRLAELLRPDDDILQVRLFTALVDRHRAVSGKGDRQLRLWTALRSQPKITVTEGKFAARERTCLVPSCHHALRTYTALEEKQTDVNLALSLVRDVQTLAPDHVIVISGDTDLLPALDVVMSIDRKVRPVIYIPVHEENLRYRRKDEFMKYSQAVKPVPEKYLRMAQFASKVPLADGTVVERPVEWRVS